MPTPEELADFFSTDTTGVSFSSVSPEDIADLMAPPSSAAKTPTPPKPKVEDRGFLAGAEEALGEYKQLGEFALEHPTELPGAFASGIKAAGEYIAGTSFAEKREDLSNLVHEITTRPYESLGRLAVEAPAALLGGGVGGAVAKKAVAAGVKRAVLSTAGGALGASGIAGVRAKATGREVTGPEAGLAAAFGAVGGGAVGGAGREIGKLGGKLRERLEFMAPQAVAKISDAVEHFEAKAVRLRDRAVAGVYARAHEALTRVSLAGNQARQATAGFIAPLRRLSFAADEEEKLMRALRDTDEAWFNQEDRLARTSEQLRTVYGLSDEGVSAYFKILRTFYQIGQQARRAYINANPNRLEDAPHVRFGMLPHRWDAPYRVLAGEEVQAFSSAYAAQRAARRTGGLFLNAFDNRFVGLDLDAALQLIDPSRDVLPQLERMRNNAGHLRAMFAERKGVRGYTSLRSLDDLIDAIEGTAFTVNRALYGLEPMREAQALARTLHEVGTSADFYRMQSSLRRAIGESRPSRPLRFTKRVLVNSMLGLPNAIVALLNFGSTLILMPGFIIWEATKAARKMDTLLGRGAPTGDVVGLGHALAITAKSLYAGLPGKIRNALLSSDSNLRRLMQNNEAVGIIPNAETVTLADLGAMARAKVFKAGTHEAHPKIRVLLNKTITQAERVNTWLLRHSESAAKRMVATAMREVGMRMGLTGEHLDLFVHSATESTAGRFNAGMRAAILEGDGTLLDFLTAALTFQTWIAQKSVQLARMLRENPKAFGLAAGALIGAAGLEGVPIIVPMLDATIDALDESGELRAAWEKYKLDNPMLFHGLLSQTPVDLSGRFALGLPLNAMSEYAFNPMGMYDTFARMYNTTRDRTMAALYAEGLPSAIGTAATSAAEQLAVSGDLARRVGAVKALATGGEFEPVQRGRFKQHYPISQSEAIWTALLGGTPKSVAQEQRRVKAEAALQRLRRDRMTNIREAFVRTGDRAMAMKYLKAIDPSLTHDKRRAIVDRWVKLRERRSNPWEPRGERRLK